MNDRHWLYNCCRRDWQGYSWMRHPFRFADASGKEWWVATDARVLVAIPTANCALEFPKPEQAASIGKVKDLKRCFMQPDTPSQTMSLAALRDFAPCVAETVPCPACKGTSKISEYVSCTFCDGDGVMSPDVLPGWFCGNKIDRNLLGRFVHDVPGESVTVQTRGVSEDGARTFFLSGYGWLANVGGVFDTAEGDWDTAPRLGKPLERVTQ